METPGLCMRVRLPHIGSAERFWSNVQKVEVCGLMVVVVAPHCVMCILGENTERANGAVRVVVHVRRSPRRSARTKTSAPHMVANTHTHTRENT